jgi:hypothetical protein
MVQILSTAKLQKKDEFYTQLADIENELRHYKEQFRGKVIFCNCDDPYESNFFKYFANNFNHLGLKKLIATSFTKSPIAGTQIPLFEMEGLKPDGKQPFKVEINEVPDSDGSGAVDLADVQYLLKHDKNIATPLKGNGDFRSEECVELLKQSDIVVTNPPFSLFREYISQLIKFDKSFLIIGNTNALTYKEVFTPIKENKLRTGYTNFNVGMFFVVPGDWEKYHHIDKLGNKIARVSTSCWFTNLDVEKHHEKMTLYKKYSPVLYPKYDNYDAINVDKVAEIPMDYGEVMGVPITFLDKYNPDQFEIIGIAMTPSGSHLRTKIYPKQIQVDADGKRSSVTKLNDGTAIEVSSPPENKTYYSVDGKHYVKGYARVLIRRKDHE